MPLKIPKTRNNGTMSEAAFWGWIRSALRKRSMAWKPISVAKQKARRTSKNPNPRLKWEYQCASCKNWFSDKEIHVDHKVDAGSLRNGDDLKGFVERLFCEAEGLQVLCETCHHEKTQDRRKKIKI